MTREEIIALAVEAGLDGWFWLNPDDPDFPDEMKVIEAFFHAAQRQAYERAEKAARDAWFQSTCHISDIEDAIRALIEWDR